MLPPPKTPKHVHGWYPQVCEFTAGRVLVGHSLNKDLRVLMLSHPHKDIRDTAK
jgi:hypothetical protein